jgi:hypothetical protein
VSLEMTSRDHCARLALEPFVELHFFAGTDKELSSPRGSGAAP